MPSFCQFWIVFDVSEVPVHLISIHPHAFGMFGCGNETRPHLPLCTTQTLFVNLGTICF